MQTSPSPAEPERATEIVVGNAAAIEVPAADAPVDPGFVPALLQRLARHPTAASAHLQAIAAQAAAPVRAGAAGDGPTGGGTGAAWPAAAVGLLALAAVPGAALELPAARLRTLLAAGPLHLGRDVWLAAIGREAPLRRVPTFAGGLLRDTEIVLAHDGGFSVSLARAWMRGGDGRVAVAPGGRIAVARGADAVAGIYGHPLERSARAWLRLRSATTPRIDAGCELVFTDCDALGVEVTEATGRRLCQVWVLGPSGPRPARS